MRCLDRNKRTIYYAQLLGTEKVLDDEGLFTGEYTTVYTDPIAYRCNIGIPKRKVYPSEAGEKIDYDRVIATDTDCPITESSIVWVDKSPSTDSHDYVVRRVSRSLNSVVYYMVRVDVQTENKG